MNRPGVRLVPEGSGGHGKMEETVCEIISGAPTTLAFKGKMIMMMMMIMMIMIAMGCRHTAGLLPHIAMGCRYTVQGGTNPYRS